MYHACTKLRHYLLSATCLVVCKTDVIKYILSAPILRGRLGKWAYALIEFDLRYESAKAVKGQVIADFITAHRTIGYVTTTPWKLFFDGSTCAEGSGIGIILVAPGG